MKSLILLPPVSFVFIFLFIAAFSAFLSKYSFKRKERPSGEGKAYACGEDVTNHRSQPDNSQFFTFAFFFTILHVFTLIIATLPKITPSTSIIALIYIFGAVTGLAIIFRR